MDDRELHFERAQLYEFLSLAFAHPSHASTLEELEVKVEELTQRSTWRVVRTNLLHSLARAWLAAIRENRERVFEEYTRLFVLGAPKPLCPPYESVYVAGGSQLAGPSYQHLLRILRLAGFEVSEAAGEPAEHIAVMFELMKALIMLSLETGEQRFSCLQLALVRDHLSRWIHSFAECVKGNSRLECFRVSAEVAEELLSFDSSFLKVYERACKDATLST